MNDLHPTGGKELPPGTRLEEFLIERVLGSGGFGITYRALDVSLNRPVVIKENLPSQFAHRDTSSLVVKPGLGREDEENFRWSMENFSREAEMLASLHHPGIVKVLRRFEAFGTAYFVMPYVEGVSFDELIEERAIKDKHFSEEELRGLLERVLEALAYLHQHGIYHRDIKPGNILITSDGVPVLIDFGSARQRLGERSMTVVESPGYTPFEQHESRGNVGPWSDLYALGATLEKAITGQTPPKAMDRMRDDPRVPLIKRYDLSSVFSRQFLDSLDKALEGDECLRWQDAEEWLTALRDPSVGVGPSEAPHTSRVEQSRPSGSADYSKAVLPSKAPSRRNRKATGSSLARSSRRRWLALASIIVLSSGTVGYFKLFATKISEMPPSDWKSHAEAGDPFAQALMARAYSVGTDGYPENPKKATAWAQKSAAFNHPLGIYMLGSCIYRDLDQPKQEREQEAHRLFSKAVTHGFLKKAGRGGKQWMERVGHAYLLGRGVSKSESDAFRLFQNAAEQGDPLAMTRVGHCYERSTGVEQNIDLALEWYRKAANHNEPEALTSLGKCYLDGKGVTKDEFGAVKLFQKAAEMGCSEAMNSMSRCYWYGWGIPENKYKAYEFSSKSANLGNTRGMCQAGICLLFGDGVIKNEAYALEWLRKAAECDDFRAVAVIGICYEKGWGVAKDQIKAIELYRKAADNGDEIAVEELNRLGK